MPPPGRPRYLTARQRDALIILAGAPRSAGQLADHLGPFVSPAAARGVLRTLERKGLVVVVDLAPLRWAASADGLAALRDESPA